MISMDKKYRTRCGEFEPRILCTDAGGEFPVVGIVEGIVVRWTSDGKTSNIFRSDLDLIEHQEPDIRTIWVNVYEDSAATHCCEGDAKRYADTSCISVAQPVTFEVKRA